MTRTQLDTEINSIKDQLVRKYGAQKVVLFGSAATGKMTPDSDLDFLIVKDSQDRFQDRLAKLYTIVDKTMPADFIVYTPKEIENRIKLGDPFVKEVMAKGLVLYG